MGLCFSCHDDLHCEDRVCHTGCEDYRGRNPDYIYGLYCGPQYGSKGLMENKKYTYMNNYTTPYGGSSNSNYAPPYIKPYIPPYNPDVVK